MASYIEKTHNMLEHQKIILLNVKDDLHIFRKELIKTLRWISDSETEQLRIWLLDHFSPEHHKIIDNVLSEVA